MLKAYRFDHNRRFAVTPADAASAWRPVRAGLDVARACSFRYSATVQNDNTVRVDGVVVDIPPGPSGRTYAKALVEVSQELDGGWHVYHHDVRIASRAATPFEELRPRKQRKRSAASRAFRRAVVSVAPSLP